MKKVLLGAMLIAGTTLGFANDKSPVKTEITKSKEIKTYQFDSYEEAQKFIEDCTDIVVVTTILNGETVITSTHETTRPCIMEKEGVRVYVITV